MTYEQLKNLCAELADAYLRLLEYVNNDAFLGYEPSDDPLLKRTRAALSAAPQQPSDEELLALADEHRNDHGLIDLHSARDYARAVLALCGAQAAPVPVPVAERPWERDGWLDSDGECWAFFNLRWDRFDPECLDETVLLLPHWALPLPEDTQ